MKLDRVTMTGADDSIDHHELVGLSTRFPFVEWGILFSGSRQGTPRYPSRGWLTHLWQLKAGSLQLSAHLCGRWVRELVLAGNASWWATYPACADVFARVQLNFHGEYHKAAMGFIGAIRGRKHDYIFQHDGVNDALIASFTQARNLRAYPLFDRSGGAGVSPGEWPKPIGIYCGYAGGLGPDNLEHELHRIAEAAGDARIWIDMETKVRSDDDVKFDLGKVKACLEIAESFVVAT